MRNGLIAITPLPLPLPLSLSMCSCPASTYPSRHSARGRQIGRARSISCSECSETSHRADTALARQVCRHDRACKALASCRVGAVSSWHRHRHRHRHRPLEDGGYESSHSAHFPCQQAARLCPSRIRAGSVVLSACHYSESTTACATTAPS